jgi:hypothetical protein
LNLDFGFSNQDELAAFFCGQASAQVPDKFCAFYFEKIRKLQITLQPLKLEKEAQIWNPTNFRIFFVCRFNEFKSNQIFLNKISH